MNEVLCTLSGTHSLIHSLLLILPFVFDRTTPVCVCALCSVLCALRRMEASVSPVPIHQAQKRNQKRKVISVQSFIRAEQEATALHEKEKKAPKRPRLHLTQSGAHACDEDDGDAARKEDEQFASPVGEAAASAATLSSAANLPSKRVRRGVEQLANAYVEQQTLFLSNQKVDIIIERCSNCTAPYTLANNHTCKASNQRNKYCVRLTQQLKVLHAQFDTPFISGFQMATISPSSSSSASVLSSVIINDQSVENRMNDVAPIDTSPVIDSPPSVPHSNTRKEIHVVKQFLGACLRKETRDFCTKWIRSKVIDQHRIRWTASLLLQGFIVQQLQSINLSNVHSVLALNGPLPVLIEQNVVKQGLMLCASNNQTMVNKSTDICTYYKTIFAPGIGNVTEHHASAKHLSSTSLQDAARMIDANFRVMMQAQLWNKTKYWIRQEINLLLETEKGGGGRMSQVPIRLLIDHRTVLGYVRSWIGRHLIHMGKANDFAASFALGELHHNQVWKTSFVQFIDNKIQTEVAKKEKQKEIKNKQKKQRMQQQSASSSSSKPQHGRHLRHKLKSSVQQTTNSSKKTLPEDLVLVLEQLWDILYECFIRQITTSLIPFELSILLCSSRKDVKESHIASRRCSWVFSLLKRLEEIRDVRIATVQVPSGHDDTIDVASDSNEGEREQQLINKAQNSVKLFHLFPLPAFIPGAMTFSDKLLDHMHTDYQKCCTSKKARASSSSSTDSMPDGSMTDEEIQEECEADEASNEVQPKRNNDSEKVRMFWTSFFKQVPSFWEKKDATTGQLMSTCTQFVSDGVSASFVRERLEFETSAKKLKPTKSRKKIKKANRSKNKLPGAKEEEQQEEDESEPAKEGDEFYNYQHLLDLNVAGVLTVDTNRKNFFVAVYRSLNHLMQDAALDSAPTGAKHRDKVIRISMREYKHMRRVKRSANVRTEIVRHQQAKDAAMNHPPLPDPPSLKGTSLDLIRTYMEWMNELHDVNDWQSCRMQRFFSLYSPLTFRRLRMESYIAEQKMWSCIQDKIYRELQPVCPGLQNPRVQKRSVNGNRSPPKKRLLIAVGDGSFQHNSPGHMALPTGHRLFAELKSLGEHVCWVDEFNTSKCCSDCTSEMEQASILKSTRKPRTRIRPPAWTRRRTRACNQACLIEQSDSVNKTENISPTFPSHESDTAMMDVEQSLPLSRTISSSSSGRKRTHRKRVSKDPTRVSPWGLRVCTSSQCKFKLWCRDVNADRNMLTRVGYLLRREAGDISKGPSYLCRKKEDDCDGQTADPIFASAPPLVGTSLQPLFSTRSSLPLSLSSPKKKPARHHASKRVHPRVDRPVTASVSRALAQNCSH